MEVDPQMLAFCNVSADGILRRLAVVRQILGDQFLAGVEKYGIRTLVPIVEIVTRSAIFERLRGEIGFQRVIDQILPHPDARFFNPEPPWFQLVVGYVMSFVESDLRFEAELQGKPKDILIRGKTVHIECKSFTRSPWQEKIDKAHLSLFRKIRLRHDSGDWTVRIERDVTDGDPYADVLEIFSTLSADELRKLTEPRRGIRISATEPPRIQGPMSLVAATGVARCVSGVVFEPLSFIGEGFLVVEFHGPRYDEIDRIEGKLLGKLRQLVSGISNVVALDVAQFTGDFHALRIRIEENVFSADRYRRISGVLFVRYLMEGCRYRILTDFARNPYADVPLPAGGGLLRAAGARYRVIWGHLYQESDKDRFWELRVDGFQRWNLDRIISSVVASCGSSGYLLRRLR
ncbi:MAG: hypothetical protein ACT4P5_02640 [Armatimonadota bacterium]